MKGGVAAMCAAAARAADGDLRTELIVAAVVDEEYASAGSRTLVESGIRADAAIVTEPTLLGIGPAHRGFTWVERGSVAKVSLFGLSFPDALNGWATGEKGTIVRLSTRR